MFRESCQKADRCCLETRISQSEEPRHTRVHLSCSSGDLAGDQEDQQHSWLLLHTPDTSSMVAAFRKRTEKTHTFFFLECVCVASASNRSEFTGSVLFMSQPFTLRAVSRIYNWLCANIFMSDQLGFLHPSVLWGRCCSASTLTDSRGLSKHNIDQQRELSSYKRL